MRARRTPVRLAVAASILTFGAAAVALVPWGVTRIPALSVLVLVAAPALAWLLMRRIAGHYPDELWSLAKSLAGAAADPRPEPERTTDPQAAAVFLEADDFLRSLDQALSQHRRARIEAEDEDRTETEFLKDLSHELRTPLNAILGFASVLIEEIDGPLNDSQREDAETILASGEHLSALIDDVLDMAALHTGHIALKHNAVDVGAVLRDVGRLLEAQRRDKPLEIRVEVEDGLSPVRADEKRLRQIVMNLGTNAIKFTERGEVVLSAKHDGDGVGIAVRDTGPGIPPSDRDSIFLEFTQVSSGVMRRTQGSGLGLTIVKRLTELHGGKISLESAMGEGSSFQVWLPLETAVDDAEAGS